MRDSRVIDIAFGGSYASTAVDTGEVSVFRLLDFNVEAVHVTMYAQKFQAVPSAADVRALSPLVLHVPIDARTLMRDDELQLICADPLSEPDLIGYMTYLENMGVGESDRGAVLKQLIGFSHDKPIRLRLRVIDDELHVEDSQ